MTTYEESYYQFKKEEVPEMDWIKLHEKDVDNFEKRCQKEFANPFHDKAYVNAMNIFQELVQISQDLQLSESGITFGNQAAFVDEFRKLEYGLRDLVEDKMRKQAFEILDDYFLKVVPPYSVGGVNFHKQPSPKMAVIRNVKSLRKIRRCLRQFVVQTIYKIAGKSRT